MTRLLGGPEMFLDTWSGLVNLTCVVETLEPPRVVEWYHNNTQVRLCDVHHHNPELSIIVLLTSFISFRHPSSLGNGASLLLNGCCYHYFILFPQLLNFLRGMCLSPNVPNVSASLTCNL